MPDYCKNMRAMGLQRFYSVSFGAFRGGKLSEARFHPAGGIRGSSAYPLIISVYFRCNK